MGREGEGDVFEAGAAVLEFVAEGLDLDGGVFFFGGHSCAGRCLCVFLWSSVCFQSIAQCSSSYEDVEVK